MEQNRLQQIELVRPRVKVLQGTAQTLEIRLNEWLDERWEAEQWSGKEHIHLSSDGNSGMVILLFHEHVRTILVDPATGKEVATESVAKPLDLLKPSA